MKKRKLSLLWFSGIGLSAVLLTLTACNKSLDDKASTISQDEAAMNLADKHGVKAKKHFEQVNLVANNDEYDAAHLDPMLLNAWGLAFSPTGTAWISAQAGHVSTVYDGQGVQLRPAVNIPSPGSTTGGSPTGIVFNGSNTDFLLPAPNNQPARFVFVGDDGVVSGWNSASGNDAMRIADNSATAAYTGLAMASTGNANYLYAANFKTGRIDVWDHNFNSVSMPFADPAMPTGYSPFNIQNIDGMLYVMYAKVGVGGEEETGMGKGFVDIYRPDGSLLSRFLSRGQLNAPWGIAKADKSFMKHDKDDDDLEGDKHDKSIILVGNFGNGNINAYRSDGKFEGELWGQKSAIEIEGLWAISFAPSTATSINPDRLYFTAGPDDEEHGLFGYIKRK